MADDKVVCPFHNAAFSILTGEPEHAPALDGLPVFEVIEKDGKVFVKIPPVLPKK
jgi:nitrite reductase/ring-hydroxylating ferredoxin subunit